MNKSPNAIEGVHYFIADGRVRPIVRGGDGPVATITDLTDQRAAYLDEIDDIIRSAQESADGWTDVERSRHDELVDLVEGVADADGVRSGGLDAQIAAAEIQRADQGRSEGAEARRARYATVGVNTSSTPAHATRSLDELLWASSEEVQAGSFGKTGQFSPHATSRNAVEQVAVRSLNDEMVLAPRIDEIAPQHRHAVRAFQRTVEDMAIFGLMIDSTPGNKAADGFEIARSHKLFKPRWEQICRALDVDTAGEGGSWVPTGIGASMHEKVRAAGKVAALFNRIDLPTNPWKWPIEGADATAYRVAEPTGDSATKVTASTPGTGAATFDAEILGGRILWSRSLEADSAVAILPYTKMKLVRAFVDGEEKAILDGDTDGTHQDADVQALGATDVRTSWDGLRKRALANSVVTAATTTAANLGLIRAGMGKWGLNPNDTVYIIGVTQYHKLLADSAVLTVDKMGPQATILNGQLASVNGCAVIVSEHVREDLNATGVQDGITTTKTYNLAVNRQEWAMGQRTPLDVEIDDSIYRETYQRVMVAFMREDFQNIGDASTNDDTSIAYNVA